MAGFPSSSGSIPLTLEQTFTRMRDLSDAIKKTATSLKSRSVAGPVPAVDVTAYCMGLSGQRDQMAAMAATTGLQAYVTSQYPAVDITVLYTTMIQQVDATLTWITNNYPKAAGGELLERTFGAGGKTVNNTFSTSALATFRTQLDLLIATID